MTIFSEQIYMKFFDFHIKAEFFFLLLLIVRCVKINIIVPLHFQISMDIKEKIGLRLRDLRKEKGLSQEKFAFECNLDRTYITSIELGKRNVSIVNIEKIAEALNISVEEFFNSTLFQSS